MGFSGERLADARRAAGLTQDQLAELMATQQRRVSDWERGVIDPQPASIPRLTAESHDLRVVPRKGFRSQHEFERSTQRLGCLLVQMDSERGSRINGDTAEKDPLALGPGQQTSRVDLAEPR